MDIDILKSDFKRYLSKNYNNGRYFKVRGMANDFLIMKGYNIHNNPSIFDLRRKLCHCGISIINKLKSKGLIKKFSAKTYEVIDN